MSYRRNLIAIFLATACACSDSTGDNNENNNNTNNTNKVPGSSFSNLDGTVTVMLPESQVPEGGITVQDLALTDVPESFDQIAQEVDYFGELRKAVDLQPDGAQFDPPIQVRVELDAPAGQGVASYYGLTQSTESATLAESLNIIDIEELPANRVALFLEVRHFTPVAVGGAPLPGVSVEYTGQRGPFDLAQLIFPPFLATVNEISTDSIDFFLRDNECISPLLPESLTETSSTGFGEYLTARGRPTQVSAGGFCKKKCTETPLDYRGFAYGTHPLFLGARGWSSFFGSNGTIECDPIWHVGEYAADGGIEDEEQQTTVQTLIIDSVHYPSHQFRLAQPDQCEANHWHALYNDFLVFTIDSPAQMTEPDAIIEPEDARPFCGFGQEDELQRSSLTIPYVDWRIWAQNFCESDSQCGENTD